MYFSRKVSFFVPVLVLIFVFFIFFFVFILYSIIFLNRQQMSEVCVRGRLCAPPDHWHRNLSQHPPCAALGSAVGSLQTLTSLGLDFRECARLADGACSELSYELRRSHKLLAHPGPRGAISFWGIQF